MGKLGETKSHLRGWDTEEVLLCEKIPSGEQMPPHLALGLSEGTQWHEPRDKSRTPPRREAEWLEDGAVTQVGVTVLTSKIISALFATEEGLPPKTSAPLASTADPMKAVLSLLLPCLLAEGWLVPSLAPGPRSPEAQATQETLQTPTAQNETEGEVDEPWLEARGQQLSEDASNLGFSLLRKISMKHEGNVVFSPLGLSLAMAALTLGAKGPTKAQLDSGLRLQVLNQTQPRHLPALFRHLRQRLSRNQELGLTQGSLAFVHEDFDAKETFLNVSKRYFDTECVALNFRNASQAKGLMNHYINKETEGKIPKLFDEVNPDTKLILVDYILLKGILIMFCSPKASTSVSSFSLFGQPMVNAP